MNPFGDQDTQQLGYVVALLENAVLLESSGDNHRNRKVNFHGAIISAEPSLNVAQRCAKDMTNLEKLTGVKLSYALASGVVGLLFFLS